MSATTRELLVLTLLAVCDLVAAILWAIYLANTKPDPLVLVFSCVGVGYFIIRPFNDVIWHSLKDWVDGEELE